MKKLYIISLSLAAVLFFTSIALAQTVANYSYKLDNGVVVKTERGWNYVKVSESFIKQKNHQETGALTVKVRATGNLISTSEVTVLQNGVAFNPGSLAPGNYDLNVTCRLSSANKGNITFEVRGISIKSVMENDAKGISTKYIMDTSVDITVHDVQIVIEEKAVARKGLARYETRSLNYVGTGGSWNLPLFYRPGDRTRKIMPDEPAADYHGAIKPGNYDICQKINIEWLGFEHKIWLQNMELKADTSYKITCILNSAEVIYTGGVYSMKELAFYPPGYAIKMKDKPQRNRKLEVFSHGKPWQTTACPPGTYDLMLDHHGQVQNQWREGVVLEAGKKTEVK
ncbi:MAG: hypothetical protein CVU52_07185 [Deltaproteobacteria bacterium HGW-Deltaproteobacteria-10]|nr:MAG: hypothetical protein CVU52_07185 [Deltaproteobacteria bacterium HGW-Deltaproteobacteria-10]